MSPVINKFLVAIVTFLGELAIILNMTPEVDITTTEWLLLAVGFIGALGVYAVPNSTRSSV